MNEMESEHWPSPVGFSIFGEFEPEWLPMGFYQWPVSNWNPIELPERRLLRGETVDGNFPEDYLLFVRISKREIVNRTPRVVALVE